MFGMESFTQMPDPRDLAKIFDKSNPENTKWLSFRDSPDSNFVSLVLPHTLRRVPYGAETEPVDLVVLDMVMPHMNGADLAERLREIDPNCRILLSSGYTLDRDAEALLQAGGFIGFLPKHFRMGQLVRHVRRALDMPIPTS